MSEAQLGTAKFTILAAAPGVSGTVSSVNAALSTMEQAVAQNWWGLRNLGLAFAALPAAVAAGVGAAVKAAMAWETAMAGVEKTTYDTNASVEENRKNLGELEEQLIDLSRTKPIASVEIAGIAENGAALGIAQKDIKDYTATVADLAATTDYTTEQAGIDLARIAALTGVPAAGFDNLASAILETGRATAATEPEIGAYVNQLAGLHGVFKIPVQDLIGLGSTLASLNIKTQKGVSAIQRTFSDISRAASLGGEDLETFASIAGSSADEFAKKFKTNASGAFSDVIVGLSRMLKEGKDLTPVLDSLGIKEVRQIQVLSLLATGQASVTNENIKLTHNTKLANKAFQDGTAAGEISAKIYGTLSNQLKILKNNFFEVSMQAGKLFLPALKAVVSVVESAVTGFRVMPTALKYVMAAIIGLATAFSLVGAAALLLLPRIVQTRLALRSIGEQYRENKAKAVEASLAVEQHGKALVDQQVAAGVAVNASKAHEAALNNSILANERASEAEALHTQAVLGIGEALAVAGTAEAAYTRAQIASTEARMAVAKAEYEARTTNDFSQMGAKNGPLIEAKAQLAVAERDLAAATTQAQLAQDGLTASQDRAVAAATASAEAQQRAAVTENELALSKERVVVANAEEAASTAAVDAAQERHIAVTGEAIVAENALGASRTRGQALMAGFTKGLGIATVAMIAFSVYTAYVGNEQRKAEEKIRHQQLAVQKLVDAYVSGDKAGRKTINGYIKQQVAQNDLIETSKRLGISQKLLNEVINNTVGPKNAIKFRKAIAEGDKKGVTGAKEFGAAVYALNRQIANSKSEALGAGASYAFVAGEADNAADAAKDFAASQDDVDAATAKATASTDYIGALYDEQSAAFDVVDAQQALGDARREGAKNAQEIQKAEISLISARATAARSADAIAAAERDLSTARARQDEAVTKASLSLADAQDRHLDSIDKVAEAQETLNDLRNPKETDDLTKAVESLRDAEKGVRDAQQKGADAQWYLNYLREEGAGKRDIKVATNAQKDAADELAKATTGQADAQKELSKVTDPANKAKEIAKAERDLAAARRDVKSTSLAITEAERGLSDARSDKASNKLVRDAEKALQDARLQSKSDVLAVKDAEDQLAEARRKSVTQGILKAQYELEQAYYKQAQAIAEARKQQALMNGETFDAKDDADNLALALQQVVDSMPNGEAKRNLQAVIDILKKVPEIPKAGVDLGTGEEETGPVGLPGSPADKDPIKPLAPEPPKVDYTHNPVFDDFKRGLDVIHDFLDDLNADFERGIHMIGQFFTDMHEAFQRGIHMIGQFFTDLYEDFQRGLGVIGQFFTDLYEDFQRGIHMIGDFVSRFVDTGARIIGGLWLGLVAGWDAVVDWVRKLGRKIVYHVKKGFGLLVKGGGVLIQAGKDVIGGFLEGLKEIWKDVVGWVSDAADHLPGVVKKVLGISSPSKVFRKLGLAVGQGLNEGVQASMKDTAKNFEKSVKAITPDLIQKQFESFGLTGLDVAAYAGTGPTSRAPIAAPAPPAVLAGANAQDRAPVHNDIDYNLTAITDADPKQIFDRFAWEEKIKTRGNGNYR